MISLSNKRPVIDWKNPLTRLLLWNVVPSFKLTDLVSGGVGKLVTSGSWNATSTLGKALKSTSTTNGGAYWPWSRKFEKITNKVTIIVFTKPNNITSFSHFFCIPAHSTWTSPYSSISFGQFDTSGKLNYQITASGVLHNTTSSGVYITAGDPLRCYGVSVDGANARFFVDGIFQESVALTNTGTIDLQDKVEAMLMNRVHGDLGEGLQGLVPWAGVWGRNLSDREMNQMAKNPFRIYQNRLPFFGRVPGGTSYSQTLTESIILNDALIRGPSRTLSEVVTLVDSVIKTTSRTLSEAIVLVDSVLKTPVKVLTDVVTLVDSLIKTPGKVLSEAIVLVDTVIRDISRILSEVITIVDTVLKSVSRTLSDVVTLVDTFVKGRSATLTETVTIVDTLERSITHVLTEVITIVDTVIKTPARTLSEAITLVDSVIKNGVKNLTETVTLVDSVVRTMARTLSEAITIDDRIVRSVSRTLSEVVTLVDTLVTITGNTYTKVLEETIVINDAIVRGIGKVLTETIRMRDTLFRNFVRAIGSWTKKISNSVTWTKKTSETTVWEQDEGQ